MQGERKFEGSLDVQLHGMGRRQEAGYVNGMVRELLICAGHRM